MQVSDQMKFYLSAAAGALGVGVTLLFIPEISTLDLKEGDLRWDAIKAGKPCARALMLTWHGPALACCTVNLKMVHLFCGCLHTPQYFSICRAHFLTPKSNKSHSMECAVRTASALGLMHCRGSNQLHR